MSSRGTYCAGRLTVTTADNEMRPSQWVCAPHVVMTETGAVCLDLTQTHWDLAGVEETPDALHLTLQKYPDSRCEATVTVIPASGGLALNGKAVTAASLEAALEACS
jgi:hypothetical protein